MEGRSTGWEEWSTGCNGRITGREGETLNGMGSHSMRGGKNGSEGEHELEGKVLDMEEH
jgi:hypothetical protein